MIDNIDELGVGFPMYIWDFIKKENANKIPISLFCKNYKHPIIKKMIDQNIIEVKIDIYYNDHGHPKYIHDKFGALEIPLFRTALVNEVCVRNSTNEIYKIMSDAFAIISKSSNCNSFIMIYKCIPHFIIKNKITILNDYLLK